MSSDPGDTTVIRTIGRYRAFDELGRGAMGVVYRGFDPIIGRTVALKTIRIDTADPQAREFRDRLYREAAAAGALSHPNIVTIFDIIEDGGVTAVAMEFIEGRSLAAIIAERAPLPIDLAVEILGQMCSALDYAGSHGIVHRDIKPANILVTSAGRAKVTDFGVARLALSTMTQAGTVLGSPSYMSPEQVRGLSLDGRSDLFSAAVVFFEMITHRGRSRATTSPRRCTGSPTRRRRGQASSTRGSGPGSRMSSNARLPRAPPTGFKPAPTWSPSFGRSPRLARRAGPRRPLPLAGAPPPVPPIVAPAPPGSGGHGLAPIPGFGSSPAVAPSSPVDSVCSSRRSRSLRSQAGRPSIKPPRQRRRGQQGRAAVEGSCWLALRQ